MKTEIKFGQGIKAGLEEMKASLRATQEMMETAINYIWSKLETIKYQVKNAL
jgi:hypothetical protein